MITGISKKTNFEVLTDFTHLFDNEAVMCYVCDRLNIFQKVYDPSIVTGKSYRSYMTLYDYRDLCMAGNPGEF